MKGDEGAKTANITVLSSSLSLSGPLGRLDASRVPEYMLVDSI